MTPDPILTVEEHDSAMGEVARGGAWTPLVDHDTALRARAEAAEARVADLTEALRTAVGMLDGFVERVADAWAPQHEYAFRGALADLHDALSVSRDVRERCSEPNRTRFRA